MIDQDPELDSEIREIVARTDGGRHPSADELAAYAGDEMSNLPPSGTLFRLPPSGGTTAAETERLQQHLATCRECTAAVLALQFPRLEGADQTPEAEVAADVEAIVSRVRQDRADSRRRILLAAAAVLAAACLALASLVARLGRQVGELEDALRLTRAAPTAPAVAAETLPRTGASETLPRTGVPIVDLYPRSVVRGEPEVPRTLPLPADAAMVALILNPPSGLSHDAYELRIYDTAGELWRGPAGPGEAGTFVLMLPRRFAEAGVERVVLVGIDGTSERELETYRLRFELEED